LRGCPRLIFCAQFLSALRQWRQAAVFRIDKNGCTAGGSSLVAREPDRVVAEMLVRRDVLRLLFLELLLERPGLFLSEDVLAGLRRGPLERSQSSERVHTLDVRIAPLGARHGVALPRGRVLLAGWAGWAG